MYDFPNDLDQISEDLLWQIININVGAVTMMSRIIIPQMKINRRGIIVNISSGSECQPTPLMVRKNSINLISYFIIIYDSLRLFMHPAKITLETSH